MTTTSQISASYLVNHEHDSSGEQAYEAEMCDNHKMKSLRSFPEAVADRV